ncbi:hypothetical protein O3M35_011769 [Rhynocoris fuscipes]|uniref:Uncharacterized protein n=1 Tax=Rhynocoris fuscipes TaxID=488301 RepID=A0AAW1D3M4_9HEMI
MEEMGNKGKELLESIGEDTVEVLSAIKKNLKLIGIIQLLMTQLKQNQAHYVERLDESWANNETEANDEPWTNDDSWDSLERIQ